MRKSIYSFILLSLLGFSCGDETTEGISKTTYFPIFKITGDEEVFSKVGSPYSDPGVEATEKGQPIEVTTTFIGEYFGISGASLGADNADRYAVTYGAINVDGFPASAARTVWHVGEGNFAPNVEGLYVSNNKRNGSYCTAATCVENGSSLEYIIIKKTGANTYAISDAIGGWYEYARALGVGYAAVGATFTVNDIATNNITSTSNVPMGAFGGSCKITSIAFDVPNKKMTVTTDCASFGYTFTSILTQVDLW